MPVKANLISIDTLVESPFIIATIGGYTFGSYSAQGYGAAVKVTYPNFMKSMQIQKVNGTVNMYTLNFSYQVRAGEDPNLLDKIFSKATKDRQILLQYGDWNAPSYIYKEELAIITNIKTNLNMNNSCIDYTLYCTSDATGIASLKFNFPARTAKPSDVLKQLVENPRYGLKSVFTAMQNNKKLGQTSLIASNDMVVELDAKLGMTPLAYMNYLVGCMKSTASGQSSTYLLSIHQNDGGVNRGVYFKVTEVAPTKTIVSADTYEVDVNFPDDNFVTQFSLNNDQSWSLLYQYDQEAKEEQFVYTLTDEGALSVEYAPSLLRSKKSQSTSASKSSWWTRMTEFPIEASLTIKGLTRPAILMNYVKVNVWFHGAQKHISSGLYIITKQVDTIDSSGYKTALTLLRVGGDE